ncbi:MAG: hypothetical protein ACR2QC_05450 [Gammaproteobacteria bacterium]
MAVLLRYGGTFALLIKIRHSGEKTPPFRRKPESHSPKANSLLRRRFSPLPPSHSCESRNLRRRKAAGNCTAFGVEIPAFAGMGRSLSLDFAEMGRGEFGYPGIIKIAATVLPSPCKML